MKKIIAAIIILTLVLLPLLQSCIKINLSGKSESAETVEESHTQAENLRFSRLKHVKITRGTKNLEYNISWNNNIANLEYSDDGRTVIIKGKLDPESMNLTFRSDEPNEFPDIYLFQYDDQQRIVKVYKSEKDTSEFSVITYGENNLAYYDGQPLFKYDAAERRVTRLTGSSIYRGLRSMSYEELVIDPNGNIENVTNITYKEVGEEKDIDVASPFNVGGFLRYEDPGFDNYQKTVDENYNKKYSYDDKGNLIKYEDDYETVVFEYYDEPIQHVWERIVPLMYVERSADLLETPFLWYLK